MHLCHDVGSLCSAHRRPCDTVHPHIVAPDLILPAVVCPALLHSTLPPLQPLFDKAKVAELAVKYGAGSSQGKLVVGHSDDEGSDEGWGATLGEDDEGAAGRKRGPGKDKKGAKGAGKGRKGGE